MKQSNAQFALSWRLMEATAAASQSLCYAQEAADHYKEDFGRWDSWCCWWNAFLTSWTGAGPASVTVSILRGITYSWLNEIFNPDMVQASTGSTTAYRTYMFHLVKKDDRQCETVPVWAETEAEAQRIIRQFYGTDYFIGTYTTDRRRFYGGVYARII